MILNDAMILLFAFIALIESVVFLIFLNRIPRGWRLGIYLFCIAMHLFAALVLIFAFIMTQFSFSVCVRAKDRESIEIHNEIRQRVYGLIEQKRTEGVTDRQMADSIAENLKEFRYSYESRRAEIESEKRIEDALKKLRPAGSPPEGKETAKIIYLEFGFAPPTEKIVIDLENEKISYEFSYTIGKIGKEGYKKREIPPKTVKALKAKLAGFSTARWEDRYSAPHVRDGTQWQLEITFSDGSSRMISGSNAWPKDFDRLGIGEIRKKARDEAKP